MDPPLINESSFSATNSSAHSLAEIWPLGTDPDSRELGLRISNLGQTPLAFRESSANLDGSTEESTLTEQSVGGGGNSTKRKEVSSEDESSKMVSRGNANDLRESNGKRMKLAESPDENACSIAEAQASTAAGNKQAE